MKYWDSSAIVPLLIEEATTDRMIACLKEDPEMITWWGTEVESMSAIARLEREGSLDASETTKATERLREASLCWNEVQPVAAVREQAKRLLRVHPLRAADSMQLAAALIAAEHKPPSLEFVCLDERLTTAAGKEGFALWKVDDARL